MYVERKYNKYFPKVVCDTKIYLDILRYMILISEKRVSDSRNGLEKYNHRTFPAYTIIKMKCQQKQVIKFE